MRAYIADRQATWNQVRSQHLQYLRAYPAVFGAEDRVIGSNGTSQIGTASTIPWLVNNEQSLAASEFSYGVLQGAVSHIAGDWIEPTNVLAVGSRPYDRSPFGAMDMILNAGEIVLPNPGGPVFGEQRSLQMNWISEVQDTLLDVGIPGLATSAIPLREIIRFTHTPYRLRSI